MEIACLCISILEYQIPKCCNFDADTRLPYFIVQVGSALDEESTDYSRIILIFVYEVNIVLLLCISSSISLERAYQGSGINIKYLASVVDIFCLPSILYWL